MYAHDAEASYRKLEMAYQQVQAAQSHLRSLHTRMVRSPWMSAQIASPQELNRVVEKLTTATQTYVEALHDYHATLVQEPVEIVVRQNPSFRSPTVRH